MRSLLTIVLLLGLGLAQADELEITISGQAFTDTQNLSTMTLQFIIDTTSGQQNYIFGPTTLDHWDASNMALTDVSVTLGGQTLLSATSAAGGFFADRLGGLFSTEFGFNVNGTGVGLTFDAGPGLAAPTSDTFKSLFTGFTEIGGDGGAFTSPTQTLQWDPNKFTITDLSVSVPEPDTLALMLLGFGAVLAGSRLSAARRTGKAS